MADIVINDDIIGVVEEAERLVGRRNRCGTGTVMTRRYAGSGYQLGEQARTGSVEVCGAGGMRRNTVLCAEFFS